MKYSCCYFIILGCFTIIYGNFTSFFGTNLLTQCLVAVAVFNDEHDCNVVSMNSLNIHDANDMQSHKLGDVVFDEDDISSPPSFDEQIYYDDSMPPIYDDYNEENAFGRVLTLGYNDPLCWRV